MGEWELDTLNNSLGLLFIPGLTILDIGPVSIQPVLSLNLRGLTQSLNVHKKNPVTLLVRVLTYLFQLHSNCRIP